MTVRRTTCAMQRKKNQMTKKKLNKEKAEDEEEASDKEEAETTRERQYPSKNIRCPKQPPRNNVSNFLLFFPHLLSN